MSRLEFAVQARKDSQQIYDYIEVSRILHSSRDVERIFEH